MRPWKNILSIRAIARNKGNFTRAAAESSVSRPSLYDLMSKLGIERKSRSEGTEGGMLEASKPFLLPILMEFQMRAFEFELLFFISPVSMLRAWNQHMRRQQRFLSSLGFKLQYFYFQMLQKIS